MASALVLLGVSLSFGAGFAIFPKAIFFCACASASLFGLMKLFGDLFGGSAEPRKILSVLATLSAPLALALFLSLALFLINGALALIVLASGLIGAIILGSFSFASVFGLNFNKAALCAFCAYSSQAIALMLLTFIVF